MYVNSDAWLSLLNKHARPGRECAIDPARTAAATRQAPHPALFEPYLNYSEEQDL